MSDQHDEYGYEGSYEQPMPGEGRPQSNVLGIVGFILSFCVSPIGLILSLIALRKPPRGLAIGGVVVGVLGTVVWAVLIASMAAGWKYIKAGIEGVTDYQQINAAMTSYHQNNGSYASSLDDLSGLTSDEKIDAWGTAYRLEVKPDGSGWDLISAGMDGKFGTSDDITLTNDMSENEVGNRIGEAIQRHLKEQAGK